MSETLNDSFSACLDGLRKQSDCAATVVWNRFAPKLRNRVNTRLLGQTRSVLDADDVLQSVFKSFFCRFQRNRFDLNNWVSLWLLLLTITDRKCGRKNQHFTAKKRSPAKAFAAATVSSNDLVARVNSPAENASFAETLELLFQSREEKDRQILWFYLRGVAISDVAQDLKLSQRSIQRAIRRAEDWLRERLQT